MYSTIQKTIVAWAFNHYIAYYYFDNVNVSQLKVAFEKGELELENLPIKKDALQHFNLPMEVVSGIVGKLSIKVPLMTPLTDSWLIKIKDLMIIVAPKRQLNSENNQNTTQNKSANVLDESISSFTSEQVQSELLQEAKDANFMDYIETNSIMDESRFTEEEEDGEVSSEETKLAKFFESFSATVSSMVSTIYKNIRLEIGSMNVVFQDFDHGVVKFNLDTLLLHKPKNVRNLVITGASIYLSNFGLSHRSKKDKDLVRICAEKCNLDIHDEASGNVQLVVVDGIEGGFVYIVDNSPNPNPLLEFCLYDCRILQFTENLQQNGIVFAKVGCRYYDREKSSWQKLLLPWTFNLNWEQQSSVSVTDPLGNSPDLAQEETHSKHTRITLKSDEIAEFFMTSTFLDICDTALKGMKVGRLTIVPFSGTGKRHSRTTSDFSLNIPGLKLTLIDELGEQFIEASFVEVIVKFITKLSEQILDCSVQEIKLENLMPDCEKFTILDRADDLDESGGNKRPALRLLMDRVLGSSFGVTLFRQAQLSMCELVLNIEEKLILKLVEFISFKKFRGQQDLAKSGTSMGGLIYDLDSVMRPGTSADEVRLSKYYFDLLRIDLSSLRLSVFTSPQLSTSMQRIKSYLGLNFFAFEDAQVQLAPYFRLNVFRTVKGFFKSVTNFYKRQILEQAPKIVGQQIQNYLRFHLSDLLSTLYDEVYYMLFN